MRTDDLIAALAADDTPAAPISGPVLGVLLATLALTGAAALAALGLRGDLLQAIGNPDLILKWLLPLGIALPALITTLRLTRPTVHRVPGAWLVAVVGATAFGMLLKQVLGAADGTLWPQMRGASMGVCLSSIVGIALLPLLLALRALRRGASPAPMLSGAMAGLASGGLATALYALHCNEDAPLFFLTWYGCGILLCGALGAAAGRHMLRW